MRVRSLALVVTLAAAEPLSGQTLPLRNYTTNDGLAHDWVLRIRRDSRGLLWFATYGGLSRFDGSRFVTFELESGLPYSVINDVFEAADGRMWIATNGGGVARFDRSVPKGGSTMATIESAQLGEDRPSNRVNVIHQDPGGALWLGTDGGLFRASDVEQMKFEPVPLRLADPDRLVGVFALASAPDGDLWAATTHGLVRLAQDGRTQLYVFSEGEASRRLVAVRLDRQGLVWVGGSVGLTILQPGAMAPRTRRIVPTKCQIGPSGELALPEAADVACRMTAADGLRSDSVVSLHELPDGEIAIGTRRGLVTLGPDGVQTLVELPAEEVEWVLPDRDAGFWIGTMSSGAFVASRTAFRTVSQGDGQASAEVQRLLFDRRGQLYAVGANWTISRVDAKQVVRMQPRLPPGLETSVLGNPVIRDRDGGWWLGSGRGLFRFAPVEDDQLSNATPMAVYNNGNELPGDQITQLFEDSRGDIWIGVVAASGEVIVRWNRASRTFQRFPAVPGLRRFGNIMAIAEDRARQLWFGFREGGLSRFSNGRFAFFGAAEGVDSPVRALHVDGSGRLWCGLYDGVLRVDDPTASAPRFVSYGRAQGLASGQVYSFASDRIGRIYIGYDQGLDRLDPQAGAITHYGQLDGVPPGVVNALLADGEGNLWVGTRRGLARLEPGPERIPPPPRVRIAAVRAGGVAMGLSPLGEETVAGPRLRDRTQPLEIEFFGLADRLNETLRFEYRLDDLEWSRPTTDRSVTYASVSPGLHRFEVRALNLVGLRSAQAAMVTFDVARPLWQTWWVLLTAAIALSAALYFGYRVRLASLLRVERIRARIATDLHDDIGASLSQIAMLAEVAKYRAPADETIVTPLSGIASTSRTLVDNMADIVWAVNPKRDSLHDLIHRMRRFASDTLAAADIALTFRAPEATPNRPIGADIRREVLLILKESVTNVARHSGATAASVEFAADGGRLRLCVTDNGTGFQPESVEEGNGLDSMRKRASALGGSLEITSSPGGTIITLDVDLRAARRWLPTYIRSAAERGRR